MIKRNWDSVDEATDYPRVQPGGYIGKITLVENVEEKEYLRLEFDIAEGELAGHYKKLYESKGFWGGSFIRSYKDTALRFFKAFFRAVEKSNKGYKWNDDETKLKGKLIGLVLGEEEYTKKDGAKATRVYVNAIKPVEDIRNGNFKIPELKKAAERKKAADEDFYPIDETVADDDMPF